MKKVEELTQRENKLTGEKHKEHEKAENFKLKWKEVTHALSLEEQKARQAEESEQLLKSENSEQYNALQNLRQQKEELERRIEQAQQNQQQLEMNWNRCKC